MYTFALYNSTYLRVGAWCACSKVVSRIPLESQHSYSDISKNMRVRLILFIFSHAYLTAVYQFAWYEHTHSCAHTVASKGVRWKYYHDPKVPVPGRTLRWWRNAKTSILVLVCNIDYACECGCKWFIIIKTLDNIPSYLIIYLTSQLTS